MSLFGFKTIQFTPPTTTGEAWYRQDVRGQGLVLLSGIRPVYRLRFIVSGASGPLEYEGPLYDGLEIVGRFDALEWIFGDTASVPSAEDVELVVIERRNAVWAATQRQESVPTLRTIAATNGTATTVPANGAVTIYSDSSPDDMFPQATLRRNTRQRRRFEDSWLHGYIQTTTATFNVWLRAWSNVNIPSGVDPLVLFGPWAALAFTVPASISADAAQWAWNAGAQNVGQSLVQGGFRWPIGGGELIVENPGVSDINIHYHLAFASHY